MANKKNITQKNQIDKSNKYDKIIKENIENCALPLINKFFDLNIKSSQLSEVDVSIQKTIERETDVFKKVNSDNKTDDYLLQIEFQSKNETDMNLRMLEYYGFMYRKHKLPIKQYVIYIGEEVMKMSNFINLPDLQFRFQIINIRSIDYKDFVASNIPEYVILGILGNFGNDEPETAAENILKKLIAITETENRYKNTLEQQKYLKQIDVISQLRGLQSIIIKLIKNMAITLDITKDIHYIEAKIEGKIEGQTLEKNKNILKGHSKGMSITELADFFEVSVDYVKKIIAQK